ncbi:hypothetical protein BMS3Bbin15_00081 [archaeon BMS3Bbin15]|nr:hypothetical protein BMS3Bbin15_00081 [archaeon BMS3Bbin15]
MKPILATLLLFPWAHADPNQKVMLSENPSENILEFFGSPIVCVPKKSHPLLAKKMVHLPEVGPVLTNKTDQLYEVPHGFLSRTSSPEVELIFRGDSGYEHCSFRCNGVIPESAKKKDKHLENEQPVKLKNLILSWIDKFNEIIYFSGEHDGRERRFTRPWKDIEDIMFKDMSSKEPRMSLIVRIAQQMRREIADIARQPRRILLRTRKMHRMDRIQEVDSACLRWLVRQPGRSIVQKAGVKQELLAVVREDTFDTLENRVLKDFLVRCQYAAMEYMDEQKDFSNSDRYKLVDGFKEICRRVLRDSPIADVQQISTMPKPNYVLQNDFRYKKIWGWYQKLLKQEQELDDAWTWQSRLWSDIARMLVSVAFTHKSDTGLHIRLLGDSDARFRSEQNCGSWLYSDSLPGPFYLTYDNINYIIEFIDAFQADEHGICCNTGALGGQFYALITNIVNKKKILVVFWTVHGAGAEHLASIKELAEMASEGLQNSYTGLSLEFDEVPHVAGCILLSSLGDIEEPDSIMSETSKTKVQTILLPSKPGKWAIALEDIQIYITYVLDLFKRSNN